MPGLDPGIHQSSQQAFSKRMDHRVKPGEDDLNGHDGLLWSSDTSVAARREKADAAGGR